MRIPSIDLARHASSLICITMPEPDEPSRAIANRYTIKARSFRCVEELNELSAHDEVYWLFGAIAKGFGMTMGTHTFTNVDADELFSFEAHEGCIWGMDCQPHSFPEGEIAAAATLVEHDHGDQSEVLEGWAVVFAGAAGVLAASGAAAWAAAVVGAIGGIGAWIISMMADDHIADASWSWNQAGINEVVGKHGGAFDVKPTFTDGDATYRLAICITGSCEGADAYNWRWYE